MKTFRLILIFIFAVSSVNCISQNWECIKLNSDYYYTGNNSWYPAIAGKSIKVLHIDSISTSSNDSTFFTMPTLRRVQDFGNCFLPEKPSWIGDSVCKKSNGVYYFFNKENDSISIQSQATLNQSWICYKDSLNNKITATVDSIYQFSISGITDSVKRIGFSATDSNNIVLNYTLNTFHILLSKNHGFIKVLNFYAFPKKETCDYFYDEMLAEYIFIGKTNPDHGFVNFTLNDAFDFSVGDEFYTSTLDENKFPSPSPFYSNHYYTLDKIIDRVDYPNGDSVVYTIDRCFKTITTDTTIQGNYTTKVKYHFSDYENYLFNRLPDEVVFDSSKFSIYALAFSVSSMNRISKTIPSEYEILSLFIDSLYCEPILDMCSGEQLYIKGCGGPYTHCSIWGSTYLRELVYYKKGSEIFGTPVTCATIIGINEPMLQAAITLFPNPMEDLVVLKINPDADFPALISITDLTGRVVKIISSNTEQVEIYRDGMNSGLYFINVISSKNEKLFSGKLLLK